MNELEFRQTASRDGLTGLATRRVFVGALGKVLKSHKKVGLLFFDLDHFKAINDRFGHPAGDEVLKASATAVMDISPEAAVAGRLGGEELGLLLPGLDEAHVLELAEVVRKAIADIRLDAYPDLRVTTSIGVAMRSSAQDQPATWMAAADAALYEAKSDGPNCIRIAQSA